jgi:hypothetical protein
MSIAKTLNNTSHTIPEDGEYDWGEQATDLLDDLVDVVNGTWQTVTASGAYTTVNFDNGRNIRLVLNADTTLTLTNPRAGRQALFYIKQGGSYTLSWPSTVKWPGGSAPTITVGAGKRDVVALVWENNDGIYLAAGSQDFR